MPTLEHVELDLDEPVELDLDEPNAEIDAERNSWRERLNLESLSHFADEFKRLMRDADPRPFDHIFYELCLSLRVLKAQRDSCLPHETIYRRAVGLMDELRAHCVPKGG